MQFAKYLRGPESPATSAISSSISSSEPQRETTSSLSRRCSKERFLAGRGSTVFSKSVRKISSTDCLQIIPLQNLNSRTTISLQVSTLHSFILPFPPPCFYDLTTIQKPLRPIKNSRDKRKSKCCYLRRPIRRLQEEENENYKTSILGTANC